MAGTDKRPEFWIVTGQSGAGKTNALRILEDWGYFVLIICLRPF